MLTSRPASRTRRTHVSRHRARPPASCPPVFLPHVPSVGVKRLLTRERFRAENLKPSVPLKKNLRGERSFHEACRGRIICGGISPGKGVKWDVAASGGSVRTRLSRGGKCTQGDAELLDSGQPCPDQPRDSQQAP